MTLTLPFALTRPGRFPCSDGQPRSLSSKRAESSPRTLLTSGGSFSARSGERAFTPSREAVTLASAVATKPRSAPSTGVTPNAHPAVDAGRGRVGRRLRVLGGTRRDRAGAALPAVEGHVEQPLRAALADGPPEPGQRARVDRDGLAQGVGDRRGLAERRRARGGRPAGGDRAAAQAAAAVALGDRLATALLDDRRGPARAALLLRGGRAGGGRRRGRGGRQRRQQRRGEEERAESARGHGRAANRTRPARASVEPRTRARGGRTVERRDAPATQRLSAIRRVPYPRWLAPWSGPPRSPASCSPSCPPPPRRRRARRRPARSPRRCATPAPAPARSSSTSTPATRSTRVRADTPRMPASVEKLYTSATTLRRLGATGRLSTTVLAEVAPDAAGVVDGDLYLQRRRRPDVRRARLQPARPAGRRRRHRRGHRARARRRDGVRHAPRRAVVGVPAHVRGRPAVGAHVQPRPDRPARAVLAEPAGELRRDAVHQAAARARRRRRARRAPRPARRRTAVAARRLALAAGDRRCCG